MSKIQERHREIYPLPIELINKHSSFEQILGKVSDDYTAEERRQRWEKSMALKGGKKVREFYGNFFECVDCRHFNNGWCDNIGLPCGVNPIMTFKYGHVGMACQGMGYESVAGVQHELNFDNDLPF
jgi:hypothetical protein